MSNLVGSNPRGWVKNQVNLRQQLLGLKNRNEHVLAWQTNNTAWIRLISSVSISPEKSRELTGSESYSGGKLSQEYVLFNGTTKVETTTDENGNTKSISKQKSGVLDTSYNGQNIINNNAYGFSASSGRGLVPMPGIESISIKDMGSNGSLRSATIKIKAYNQEQFAILDSLFMHPGYTFLLEWGNTTYFKGVPEDPQYTTANLNTEAFNLMTKFLNGDAGEYTKDCLFQAILKERGDGTLIGNNRDLTKGSQGNYDGYYGKISNFKWNLQSDGSYNIEISAMSIGDVVESLTINRSTKPPTVQPTTKKPPPTFSKSTCGNITIKCEDDEGKYNVEIKNSVKEQYFEYWETNPTDYNIDKKTAQAEYGDYETFKSKTLKRPNSSITPPSPNNPIPNNEKDLLTSFIYSNYKYLKDNIKSKGKSILLSQSSYQKYALSEWREAEFGGQERVRELRTFKNNFKVKVLNTFKDSLDAGFEDLLMIQTSNNKSKSKAMEVNAPFQYMKLRKLLDFIQNNLLLYDGGDVVGENDKSSKKVPIININTGGGNFCYTQPTQLSADPNVCIIPFTNEFATITNPSPNFWFKDVIGDSFLTSSPTVGSLMELPINLHYINKCYKKSEKDGGVILLEFLDELFYGIQNALGNLNKFSVSFDHDLNEIIIRDKVPLDPKIAKPTATLPPKERTLFNINGWKKNQENGSFVEKVNISSTLSKEFMAMTSISTTQGNSDVKNTTGLSKFNVGLTDSVTPTKLSANHIEQTKAERSKLAATYNKTIDELFGKGIVESFYTKGKAPSQDLINSSLSQNQEINQYQAQILNKNNQVPSIQGFIPFNMGLDMKGFSGLRIMEKFYITTEILPKSYPDNLDFVCTGNEHKVDSKGWNTKVKALTLSGLDERTISKGTTPNNVIPFK